MKNWKNEFINEVNKINDENLRNVALEMTEEIPSYFWTIPASSSGKYHPDCDLGEGGLVRHSLMVAKCADDLITSEMFLRDLDINRDIAKIAALFHDSIKNGLINEDETYSNHTEFEHPRFASNFVKDFLTNHGVNELIVEMISGAIYTHMGKWCTDSYGNRKALSKPRTDFEKLIHLADYMASRKYIKGLEEWSEDDSDNSEV